MPITATALRCAAPGRLARRSMRSAAGSRQRGALVPGEAGRERRDGGIREEVHERQPRAPSPRRCGVELDEQRASGRRDRRSCRARRPARRSSTVAPDRGHRPLRAVVRGATYSRLDRRSPAGAGSARAIHLAVGRQRQRLEHHERRRHHVLGQPRLQERAQLAPDVGGSARRRGHDVGDQPLVARHRPPRATTTRLAHRRVLRRAPPRSRRARCGSRGSSPGGRCGRGTRCAPSRGSRTRSPVRYSRAPGSSREGVGDEPLGRQLGPVQVAPRDARRRRCTARRGRRAARAAVAGRARRRALLAIGRADRHRRGVGARARSMTNQVANVGASRSARSRSGARARRER